MLYPLKFNPILKPKLWGGNYLQTTLNKGGDADTLMGESWEISTLPGDESVVNNGFLSGNTLTELIEIYMGDLVGESIYEKFGLELPILIKLLDARKDLSVQVHPDEKYANKHFKSHGKTEMWYVLNADADAQLIAGFEKDTSPLEVQKAIENNTLIELVHTSHTAVGDVFMIPSGKVHALGKGNIVVEVQSTSDITFRLYDYNRLAGNGKPRELHLKESLEVLNYTSNKDYKVPYKKEQNTFINLVEVPEFTVNILEFDKALGRDYYFLDSFVALICTEGSFEISYEEGDTISLCKGESVLLPAALREFTFTPTTSKAAFLETYYDKK